ncbi:response regulator [Gimesia aquarii]|uniref:Translational regulator CsrA n=1 Tax=Gimesia aquarii TaxID=2527964 RepID=A0A517X044_9PLAN|nr:response regulator [Gimesia aquarii]QDU10868.1 Response regulator MprA [Gimesia aquarii]
MLVLSRRNDENIVFPNVGITVKILRIKGGLAKIGIEAPPEIRILRKEIEGKEEVFSSRAFDPDANQKLHAIRNQLNVVNLGLHLYREQCNAGLVDAANLTFLKVLDDLEKMDRNAEVDSNSQDERKKESLFRILLVEDDPRQRELLAGFLSMRGCDVATAIDGEDALNWLSMNQWPDFLVLDLRMPKCSGAETVRRVRLNPENPQLKIFAVTGASPSEFDLDQGRNGIDCWFPKPLNPEALVETMNQARQADSINITTA